MESDIRDAQLAAQGKKRIEWAERDMPVLAEIKKRFERELPLKDARVGACLHVTAETANLVRTLQAGGADVFLCASNPLSTQDDVAAALVNEYGTSVFAIRGEDNESYYKHLNAVLDAKPTVTMDDGADLISLLHKERQSQADEIVCSMEETTTGVIRLRALERSGELQIPIVAVNDAVTKNLFDNRYGTGQSTIDGIIRATDVLLAGKNFVVAGYGWCGRGLASRARGMGANVIVTEIDSVKALEAMMDGYRVMPMIKAALIGDIFCTMTGNRDVLMKEHFEVMKDAALICNSGHFDVEINIKDLDSLSKQVNKDVRRHVDEYVMKDDRRLFLLAEGRLVNLAAAEGHPASVMDMSFATQALSVEFAVREKTPLTKTVHEVPEEIERMVASLKLQSMGSQIDTLTDIQREYLSSWTIGT